MFSIIIPLYNEDQNIGILIKEIFKTLYNYSDYEVILVNDASTDQTLEVIQKLNNKKIKIINNNINSGQSFSIYKGIKEAYYNTIVTLDGDGQNDPKDIPQLLEFYLKNYEIELVGGIRYKRKDKIIKLISSKIANFVRSRLLKDNCSDTGCSLKVFNKKIFLSFPFFDGIHRFLPALFSGYGYKTYFINVNHRKRKYGISKYGTMKRLFKGIKDLIKVNNILKNIKN